MKNQFTDLWSQSNYFFYVIDGRKVWHTAHGSFDIRKGSCVFIQKGASIIEQFFDNGFCLILFFIPDKFISDTLKTRPIRLDKDHKEFKPVIQLHASETMTAFFLSMSSYFAKTKDPDPQLLELKFRELILTVADEPQNAEVISYFYSLMNDPQSAVLQRVMNDNYCFNLTLEQYAELCNRSLSAFKRDFEKMMNTSPGKWLLEKRLTHARDLIVNTDKSINEVAFESGFGTHLTLPVHLKRDLGFRLLRSEKTVYFILNSSLTFSIPVLAFSAMKCRLVIALTSGIFGSTIYFGICWST